MLKTKALIVEDDPNWIKIFQIIIGDYAQEVFDFTHVINLASALAMVENGKFDLIYLDLMLPDSFAMNTISIMAKQANHIPIVIITTLDDEKLMLNAFQHGVEDYLIKDQYDLKTFLHVSRQAIRRFLGKLSKSLQDNLEKTVTNFQSIDNKLEEMERVLNSKSQ